MKTLSTFTVSKIWLFILAGLMWSAVGIMLITLAYRWLIDLHTFGALWFGLGGLGASLLAYRFGFLHLAQKNIARLHTKLEKASPFAFMTARSYLLVVFMMGLGMTLRNSPLPKDDLAAIYLTIGGGLFFSSLHYYPHVWNLATQPATKG